MAKEKLQALFGRTTKSIAKRLSDYSENADHSCNAVMNDAIIEYLDKYESNPKRIEGIGVNAFITKKNISKNTAITK